MFSPVLFQIVGTTVRMNLRRLTTWIFAAVFLLIVVMLYQGSLSFGGMTATGVKLATNSEYAIAAMLGAFSFMLMHFTATITGDPIVKDVRLRTGALIWSTPIDRRTYVIGKFLGGYATLLTIYAVYVVALVVGQLLPSDDKLTLPFRVLPYLKHFALFVLVCTFFVGAVSFAIGTLTGSMKLVYIVITGFLITFVITLNLLGNESQRFLAYIEPSGMVWLGEMVAKSRGNAWLNANPIQVDTGFMLNRLALVGIGVACLAYTVRRFNPEGRYEYGGEIRSLEATSRIASRLASWFRGRSAALEDRYTTWVGKASVPRVEPAPRGPGLYLAQVGSSIATELRLLAAERSLWIMAPMIMLMCGVDSTTWAGPFQVPIYPVSSEFAQQMIPTLLVLLAGTTIFYTGEVFHRDDSNDVRSIIYATPVANSALLIGKFSAMVLLSLCMVGLTILTALASQLLQWQWIDGRLYLDLVPYWDIGLRVVLPAILLMCGIALAVNVLLRSRYLAYFALIGVCAGYIWLIIDGERNLVINPLLIGQWGYSDITRLAPYAPRLQLHHVYWASILLTLFGLSSWLLARTGPRWGHYFSRRHVRSQAPAVVFSAAMLVAALVSGRVTWNRSNLRGTENQMESLALALEDDYLDQWEAPRLGTRSVDVDVTLHPGEGTLDVRGSIVLVNGYPEPLERAIFTIDPLYEIRAFELDAQSGPYTIDRGLLEVPLLRPLQTGETTVLRFDWSGKVNPGVPRDGGGFSTFVTENAVFLNSFGPNVLPLNGVSPSLFLTDAEARRDRGRGELHLLRDRSGDDFIPSLLGESAPFDYVARISVPAGMTVISAGELKNTESRGNSTVFTWRAAEPLRSFAIMAGYYDSQRYGDDEIYYNTLHPYNLDTIREALADGRETFEKHFGAYPHRALRIVEFPRLASFAQAYPTIMPYSESIGFLTNYRDSDRFIDATYFVTAHEVAHQWWGYVVNPGESLGGQVLSESLAEYSAMLLLDERRGEHQRLTFLKKEEDGYLRSRDPDREVALLDLEYEGSYIWYQKGCLVFYMLERQIGRERLIAGLRSFATRWRGSSEAGAARSHPTLPDLLDEIRQQHRGLDLEWFYEQWFEQVIVPDVAITEATLRDSGGTYAVEFTATNLGDGRVPVRVEAIRGEWDLSRAEPDENFRASPSLRIWLEPNASVRGTVTADFEPERVVIDRLYESIDFDRTNNHLDLEVPAESGGAASRSSGPATRSP